MIKFRTALPLRKWAFIGLTTALLSSAAHTHAHAETLAEALQDSLNTHPSITAALANRDAMKLEKKEFTLDYFPTLKVTATGGRTYADNSTSRGLNVTRGSGYSWLWERNMTITQPLFTGFETQNKVQAANLRKDSANFSITDIREQLALQTALAYMDVMRTHEALGRIKKHRENLENYKGQIKTMIDNGAADASMMFQAMDIIAQLDTTLADHKAQADAALANYEEVVGHLPASALEKPDLHLDQIPETIEQAVALALESHAALKVADLDQRAISHETEAQKSYLYPDISGEFSYLDSDKDDVIGGEVEDYKAVLRMNWDISLAGKELATIQKARIREQESMAKKKELERRIAKEVRVTYTNLKKSQTQSEIMNARVNFTHKLFDTYQSQFKAARVNLFQLLQSDNQLFTTKLAALNSDYALIAAHYSVLASMGRLQSAFNVVPVSATAEKAVDHGQAE